MIGTPGLLLCGLLSVFAFLVSVNAWRARQTYGLFRFLGFEFLALLIAWNADGWFRNPFAFRQVLSWTIFVLSAALAIHGTHLLRSVGRARRRVPEDTQQAVEAGVYRYIRHPLCGSLLFFGWGVLFKGVDIPSGALAFLATAFWYATARCEEQFNVNRFGLAYSERMKHTRMFVPYVI